MGTRPSLLLCGPLLLGGTDPRPETAHLLYTYACISGVCTACGWFGLSWGSPSLRWGWWFPPAFPGDRVSEQTGSGANFLASRHPFRFPTTPPLARCSSSELIIPNLFCVRAGSTLWDGPLAMAGWRARAGVTRGKMNVYVGRCRAYVGKWVVSLSVGPPFLYARLH